MERLDEQQVQDFLLAEKAVTRPRQMNWVRITQDHLRAVFRVLVAGQSVGSLMLVHKSSSPKHYNLNLDLANETVLMWHFRDYGKHRNRSCPSPFPGRVRGSHAHIWVPGKRTDCVRPIDGVDGLTEREHFEVFCRRLRIRFDPDWIPPLMADQLVIPFEEEA